MSQFNILTKVFKRWGRDLLARVNEKSRSNPGCRYGWNQGPSDGIRAWLLSMLCPAHLAFFFFFWGGVSLGCPWQPQALSSRWRDGVIDFSSSGFSPSHFLQQERARVFPSGSHRSPERHSDHPGPLRHVSVLEPVSVVRGRLCWDWWSLCHLLHL